MTQAPAANHHHRWPYTRRPDGSMHPAVDGMMIEYRLAFYSFFSGLVSFHLSAALFGWMMFYPDHWMGHRPSPRPRP